MTMATDLLIMPANGLLTGEAQQSAGANDAAADGSHTVIIPQVPTTGMVSVRVRR